MGDGDFIAVDGVEVVLASVIWSDVVGDDLVTVEGVILPFGGGTTFDAAEDGGVEFFGEGKVVDREGVVEGSAGGGGGEGFV